MKIKAIIFLIISNIIPFIATAQENDVEMADIMHENGKIYVVVAVISIILSGFLIALISIDRRVKQLEKFSKKE